MGGLVALIWNDETGVPTTPMTNGDTGRLDVT